jgi:hypothetical protein
VDSTITDRRQQSRANGTPWAHARTEKPQRQEGVEVGRDMSADNWAKCPRCKQTKDAELNVLIKGFEDQYGNVPLEEWRRITDKVVQLRVELAKWDDDNDVEGCTLKENFEVYTHDGVVEVTYASRCTVCDLRMEFKIDRTFEGFGEQRFSTADEARATDDFTQDFDSGHEGEHEGVRRQSNER